MVLHPTVRPAPDHTKRLRHVFPLFICPVLSYWLIIFGNGTSYWMKYDHSFKITYTSVLPYVLHFPHVPMCLSCSEFLHFPGCSQRPPHKWALLHSFTALIREEFWVPTCHGSRDNGDMTYQQNNQQMCPWDSFGVAKNLPQKNDPFRYQQRMT